MRIAWIGPMPNGAGGASGVSNQLLRELDKRGVEVDCFVPGHEEAIPANLRRLQHIRFICGPSSWQWGKWYSRNRLMSFVTGQISNLQAENRLAHKLLEMHQKYPYDTVYQFSHIEFSSLRHFRSQLPPIVLHPSVHAYGELKWHKAEAHLSKASESAVMRIGARCLLYVRSWVQRRHIRYADRVLGLSENFANDLMQDYGVPAEKVRIVPNPIDLDHFVPDVSKKQAAERYIILFVSRIAVRKGVEMVVELSHRLNDLAGRVEIRVVGDKSLWSDYTGLLRRLNPKIANYVGTVSGTGIDMVHLYQTAHILVQPSRYEPFGLTVAEALACGTPAVASDKVGSAEHVDRTVCRIFEDGNMDEFEDMVRELLNDLVNLEDANSIYNISRSECARLYQGPAVVLKLLENLRVAH